MLSAADRPVAMNLAVDQDQQLDWDGKHPLANSWVLWYSDRGLAKEWHDCIKQVGAFETVEDFWCIFNFLKPVSMLKPGCDFYLFKKGIQPMWEDKANKQGGRWDVTVERGFKEQIDKCWMEALMALVGDGLPCGLGSIVTGTCVSKRDKNSRISIWTTTDSDSDKLLSLGKNFKRILSIPAEQAIYFRAHQQDSKFRSTNSLRC